MTPSQVAAVLGLDEEDAVRLVPLEDAPFEPPVPPPDAVLPQRRIRGLALAEVPDA